MKIRRIIALFAALVLSIGTVSCGKDDTKAPKEAKETTAQKESEKEVVEPDAPDDTSSVTPLLYKVTDDDGDVVWLFGSIHIGTEDFYPLPEYVTDAFEGADALAVEFDIIREEENDDPEALINEFMYKDGTTIKDHVSEEIYQNGVKALKKLGYYNSVMDNFPPVIWSSLIDELMVEDTEFTYELGIDRHLIELAHDTEMPVYDIESEEFQTNMMKSFSPEIQELLLLTSVEAYKAGIYEEEYTELVNVWASGDEKAFEAALESESEDLTGRQLELYEEYTYIMETERNITMTDYAEGILKEGKEEVFICVGAAHVVGEGAMADLLEERGYTVEIVK